MKQYFIEQRHLPSLTLFFAGWEWTNGLFALSPRGQGLVCLLRLPFTRLDFSLPEGYEDIRVVGWSMGWAASKFGPFLSSHYRKCGGERDMTPVDDSRGIPNAIYEGTLKGLNDVTLKVFRRMCGSAVLLEDLVLEVPDVLRMK